MLTTLALGATAAASLALAAPVQAQAPAAAQDNVSTTAWSKWKKWTLQPGVGGVEVKGWTRSRKVKGKVQVRVVSHVRDTNLKNGKNACVKGSAYTLRGGTSDIKPLCAGKKWKGLEVTGWDVRKVRLRECVDNRLSLEKCSKPKLVYPI